MPGFEDDLPHGWERTETATEIPYYINHDKEITQWDHPEMVELMTYLSGLNKIRYAAYRTAMKLRAVQKKTNLFTVELSTIRSVLQQQGYHKEGFDDSTISVNELENLITNIFIWQLGQQKEKSAQDTDQIGLHSELVLNWLLNAYDSGRTGYLKLISMKIGLVCLCTANLQDKYHYLFTQICDNQGQLDKKKLRMFLKDCLQIPKTVEEHTAFGGANVEPAVKNCLEWAHDSYMGLSECVYQENFIRWMVAEPQTVVWLPTLHRLAIAETVKHESKCNICKMYPIVGFRYKCLKCFNFDLCQECFWSGRVNKNHKVGHPTQEYCLVSTQKEDMKDFAKVMKNKVSKKKKKPASAAKRRFISIPFGGEGPSSEEEFETDGPAKEKSMEKTHKNIEHFAARLADEENLKQGIPDQEIDDEERFYRFSSGDDDEHRLIQRYSSRLAGESFEEIPEQFDRQPLTQEQRMEVEHLVASLEEDNRILHDEIEKVRQLRQQSEQARTSHDETVTLWEEKERMIAREEVLQEHNKQLEFQINRLRRKLHQVSNSALESQDSTNVSQVVGQASLNQPFGNVGQTYNHPLTSIGPGEFPTQQLNQPIVGTLNLSNGSLGQNVQTPVGNTSKVSVTDPSALFHLPIFKAMIPGSESQNVQTQAGSMSGHVVPSVTDPSVLLHPSFALNTFSKPSPFLSDKSSASQIPLTSPAVMQSVASNTAMLSMTSSSISCPSVTSPNALSSILAGLGSQTWTVTRPVMTPISSTMTSPAAMTPNMTSSFTPVVMPVQFSSIQPPPPVHNCLEMNKHSSPVIGEKKSLLFPSHVGIKAWPNDMHYEWSVDDENELNTLVDKMSTSFPLDAQSDTPIEFYNDLLVAANMVGEAVEDLVGNVSSATERH